MHGVFDANIFQGWNCWDTNLDGKQVVGCFNTLAMGTSYAVEVAQHSHTNLLRRAGCLDPSQQVKYRTPLPRGNVLQLLCMMTTVFYRRFPSKHLSLDKIFPCCLKLEKLIKKLG